jgi:hypothetical protein
MSGNLFEKKYLQILLKNIKTTRIRKDRRLTKIILKKTHNQDLLLYKICKSNSAYKFHKTEICPILLIQFLITKIGELNGF